jgi:tRNA(Ser,Leu) C12 N-acetylase TAN1
MNPLKKSRIPDRPVTNIEIISSRTYISITVDKKTGKWIAKLENKELNSQAG